MGAAERKGKVVSLTKEKRQIARRKEKIAEAITALENAAGELLAMAVLVAQARWAPANGYGFRNPPGIGVFLDCDDPAVVLLAGQALELEDAADALRSQM